MIVLPGGLMLWWLTGVPVASLGALFTGLTEGGMAALIMLAAGGYGYPLVRRLAPASAPTPLRVFTGCGLGLWLLSTAVLVVGASFTGLLRAWFWWPIIAAGVILAAWQGRRWLEAWKIPSRFDGRALVWVLLAVAAAIWLAGATRPPGTLATSDRYDVLEYHLQVPREFYHAQHIGPLKHNAYSFYPLSTEMLFLLAMCLRRGAYEGMYLAKFMHGVFGALALAAVFGTLKRDAESRGRFSAVLLGTAPFVLYLSWLAMVELAMIFYMVMAALWMRKWLGDGDRRSAACVGVMLGAACAAKYLSVGLIAAPVLSAMIVLMLLYRRRFRQVVHAPLAGLAALVLFSPWLIRNAVHTGNPVFPLATRVFGRGHWSAESEERWLNGHTPGVHPPVPAPPGWKAPEAPGRLEMLWDHFVSSEWFGPIMLMIGGVGICVVIAAGPKAPPWDVALGIILLVQIAVWMALTRDMPARFCTPALAPIAMLAGGVLSQLAAVRSNPLRKDAKVPESGYWGRPPAVALLVAAVGVNLVIASQMYRKFTGSWPPINGVPGELLTQPERLKRSGQIDLPPSARIMLIGEAQGWYWPENTIYATAFDSHPLAEMLRQGKSGREILRELRARGVSHLFVHWYEIWRLSKSYGYPEPLSGGLFDRQRRGRGPGLKILDELESLGMRREVDLEPRFAPILPWDAERRRLTWPSATIYALPWAPVTTHPATQPAGAPADNRPPAQ